MAWPLKWCLGRRTRLVRSGFLAIAVLCSFSPSLLAQTSPLERPGIGGTGDRPGEGNGIGGTGAPQKVVSTGIVGTVTGYGSIFVNGFEVEYAADTPTKSDLDDIHDAKAIRIGQVVEVEAYGRGKRLRAGKIAVRYEVRGQIESIDRGSGNIRVLGQTVAAGQSLIGASHSGSLKDLNEGDTIDISGLRRADAVIVASRIDKAAKGSKVWLRGSVNKADDKGFTLSGVRIESPASDRSRPAAGEEAAVSGAYSAGTLKPAKITRLPATPFGGRVGHLSIEGFLRDNKGSGRFVGGLNVGDAASKMRAGDRVIVAGKIGDHGRFIPDMVRPAHFHQESPKQAGRIAPLDHKFEQHGRAPIPALPGPWGARGPRWTPHHELHRDGRRWQNRGSPRRGRNRKH